MASASTSASSLTAPVSTSDQDNEAMVALKARFYNEICAELKPKVNVIETRAIYRHQVEELMSILRNKTKPKYYYFKDRYKISSSDPPELISTVKSGEDGEEGRDLVVVCLEDMFDSCMHVHQMCGHGGRSVMVPQACLLFCNVTRRIIEIFLTYSEEYQAKRKKTKLHGMVVKPIRSEYYNSRMQIDLVDMQSLPDGEYKWVLNAQDHLTKFSHLRPLKKKCMKEVAWELYLIFCRCGAPVILQSDNGKEFRNGLVKSLKLLWPGLEIVHGRPRAPQTQGSVEVSNGDWQSMFMV